MYEAQLPKEWSYIIKDSGSMVLIVPNQKIYDKVANFPSEIECLKHIINMVGSAEGSWEGLLEKGKASPAPVADLASEDEAGLIYTSGTTGNPKGVILTHGNITSNINAMHEVMDIAPEDVSLSFLPWAHSFGQVVELHGLMSMGGSLGIAESVAQLIDNRPR
jgi:long-chain acyl-CoA synthetase